MQGIRWRAFDLRFTPDRSSSWQGLAQVMRQDFSSITGGGEHIYRNLHANSSPGMRLMWPVPDGLSTRTKRTFISGLQDRVIGLIAAEVVFCIRGEATVIERPSVVELS